MAKNLPTTKQIQCFVTVAQELSFCKAASILCMTQPPLTRQIQCLEHVLGLKLFERNTHSVSLTNDGNIFFIKAKKFLDYLESEI